MKSLMERFLGLNEGSGDPLDQSADSKEPISSVESLGEQLLKDAKNALGMASTTGHVGLIKSVVDRLRHDSTD